MALRQVYNAFAGAWDAVASLAAHGFDCAADGSANGAGHPTVGIDAMYLEDGLGDIGADDGDACV